MHKRPPIFHQVIFDTLHEGLYSVDKDFRLIGFNQAAERITGYKKEEVLGKFCKNVMQADRCKEGCPLADSLELKETIRNYNMVVKNRDNKAVPAKVNAAVFKAEQEEPVGGVVLFSPVYEFELASPGNTGRSEFQGMIGQNRSMQEIYILIEEINYSNSGVLIQGESGTGKELVANAVQQTSQRKKKPFIKVNCSVFPHNLLASELFGHVKGAYTDAHRDRIVRFEITISKSTF